MNTLFFIILVVALFPGFFIPQFSKRGKKILRNYLIFYTIYLSCFSLFTLYLYNFPFRLETNAFIFSNRYHQDWINNKDVPLPSITTYTGRSSYSSAWYFSGESESEIEQYYQSIAEPHSYQLMQADDFKFKYNGITYEIVLSPSSNARGTDFRFITL